MRVGEHFANEESDCDGNTCADPVQDFEVEDEICHDFDEQTFENDICLLRLKGSIKMNGTYKNYKFPVTVVISSIPLMKTKITSKDIYVNKIKVLSVHYLNK